MHIVELRMNYDRKNFFGVVEQVTEFIDWFRDDEHMKSLVRKGLAFVCKNDADAGFHITFVDDGKRYCYNIYTTRDDRENGTVSVRTQYEFSYGCDEWVHVSVATMRKKLYAMCKREERSAA